MSRSDNIWPGSSSKNTRNDSNRYNLSKEAVERSFLPPRRYNTAEAKKLYPTRLGEREIRLLVLSPAPAGNDSAPLKYHLTHYPLQKAPTFEAVSYMWGDPGITESTYCKDQPLKVTSNLASVLHRLRRHQKGQTYWIDAICINQNDGEERNRQVQLMREIFSAAAKVLVWLGEEAENSSAAWNFVPKLVLAERRSEAPAFDADLARSDLTSYQGLGLPPTNHVSWMAFRALLSRPYFERTWIIQEIVVAKNVMVFCGLENELPWASLKRAARFAFAREFYHDEPRIANILMIDTIHTKSKTSSKRPYTMLELLKMTRSSVCSDPRDKVFAYLGISSDGTSDLMHMPDYTVSVEALYHHFAWFHLVEYGRLDLLSSAGLHELNGSLPSWVPDWRNDVPFHPQARELDLICRPDYFLDTEQYPYQFLICSPEHIAKSLSERRYPRNLYLAGKEFDVVASVAPILLVPGGRCQTYSPNSTREIFYEWEEMARSLKRYPTGQSVLEAYWRCLVLDSDEFALRPDSYFAAFFLLWYKKYGAGILDMKELIWFAERDYCEFRYENALYGPWQLDDAVLRLAIQKDPDSVEIRIPGKSVQGAELQEKKYMTRTINEAVAVYEKSNHLACYGRRLFTTRKGYLGIGAGSVEVGDSIAVVNGAKLPMVLRKKDRHGFLGEEYHVLRGECYVHDINLDEIMRNDDILAQTFWLN